GLGVLDEHGADDGPRVLGDVDDPLHGRIRPVGDDVEAYHDIDPNRSVIGPRSNRARDKHPEGHRGVDDELRRCLRLRGGPDLLPAAAVAATVADAFTVWPGTENGPRPVMDHRPDRGCPASSAGTSP